MISRDDLPPREDERVAAELERLARLVAELWGTVPGRDAVATVADVEAFLREWHPDRMWR